MLLLFTNLKLAIAGEGGGYCYFFVCESSVAWKRLLGRLSGGRPANECRHYESKVTHL